MQTLESLRAKIETASDMRSVVRTMKSLAAVSIRQYERAVLALADYNRTVELGFQIVLRGTGFPDRFFLSNHRPTATKAGAIVFGSDQGMCGPFNERIATAVHSSCTGNHECWKLLAVGTRVASHLHELKLSSDQSFAVPASVSEITGLVQKMLLSIDRWLEQDDITQLYVFFNRRTTGASNTPTQLPLLPIGPERFKRWSHQTWDSTSLPMYTMDRRRLLSCVVKQYLFVSLYRACAESLSSENASRIAAMQVAEKSIDQRLDELHAAFNQIRQTEITEELLDIVSGFEALSKPQH
ncbi:MAG: F0F1 ATP synthase subunit gamma [Planctomycetales bacterium]|nr:F0F1 ATP synthase subunit gamma [Planctomycetales bacterium]